MLFTPVHFPMHHAHHGTDLSRGFTLIELMVTVAVLLMVMAISNIGSKSSQGVLHATNTAYEVALFVREAQIRATSITSGTASVADDYTIGVHFDTATPDTLILFRDDDLNDAYDGGDTTLDTLLLPRGVTVTAVSPDTSGVLDLTFRRPNLNVRGVSSPASITISSGSVARQVVVTTVGGISVE